MKYVLNSRSILVALVILITISVIVVFASTQYQQEFQQISKDIRVENRTQSLIVESLTEIRKPEGQVDLRTFEVKLKNNSEKPIVNFSLIISDASTNENTTKGIERGGMTNEWSLLPNEIDVNRFSAESKGEIVLIIAAVLFDDGTGSGDSTELLRLRNIRTGIKLAYRQIVPILQRNLNQNETISSTSRIQSLKKEVASISDEKVPMNQKRGFSQAKDFFITELEDLKNKLSSKSNLVFSSESELKRIYTSEIAEQVSRLERVIAQF